jgi:hypothetical protein
MKKIGFSLLVVVLLTSAYIYAQGYKGKGKVIGYVYDEAGNPLEGVKVKLFFRRASPGLKRSRMPRENGRLSISEGGHGI